MPHSVDRFLTTHTGSLPRPADLTLMMYGKEEGKPVDLAALGGVGADGVDCQKHTIVSLAANVATGRCLSGPNPDQPRRHFDRDLAVRRRSVARDRAS